MSAKISFTRASNNLAPNLESMVLEAYANNQQLAAVFCANEEWRITLNSVDNQLITISWSDFLQIFSAFSEFVAGESAYILTKARESKSAFWDEIVDNPSLEPDNETSDTDQ